MSFRNIVLVCVAGVLMLGLASCGGSSKYLLKGLTLPPGSVEKDFVESEHANQQGMLFPGLTNSVNKSVTVSFDCTGGWSAVSSHVDRHMRGLGYNEGMQALDSMSGSIPGTSGMKMSNMMRSYTKDGARYGVALMNMSSVANMGAGNFTPAGLGMAEFTMVVLEFE